MTMDPAENILIYSDRLSGTEYSPAHPFKPFRARQMLDLLRRHSLIFEANQRIVEPVALTMDEVLTFHDPAYIEALQASERGDIRPEHLHFGIGTSDNPIFPGLFDFAMLASGGTLLGARMLLDGTARCAFNPVGGFHHAFRDQASGFCYINDIAIAIIAMLQQGKRVAYLDIDAHHGDGVQEAFEYDPSVLTISIHESGQTLFPGTGFENEIGRGKGEGYTVNIPLLRDSDDEVYWYAFNEIVPPLLESYQPHILVLQVGGDSHRDDPLANLNVTSRTYEDVVRRVAGLVPQVLATGGGGYNVFKTASLWAIVWATLCGLDPQDHFAGSVGGMMFGPEANAGSLRDEPFGITGRRKELCMEQARAVVASLRETTPLLKAGSRSL